MSYRKTFDLILNRLNEPTFVPKGNTGTQKRFDVPDNFIPDEYKEIAKKIYEKYNRDSKIEIKPIDLPDIEFAKEVGRYDQFSIYIPVHRRIAARLIDFFMSCETVDELEAVAVFVRDHVNPPLFTYALCVTLLNRTDCQDFLLPTAVEMFPDKFVDGRAFRGVREELQAVPEGSRVPVLINPVDTASNVNHEDRVAYFREDLGVNLNYFSFNLIYPSDADDKRIVAKDRRGELWYYLHQQIIARYNCERLCNKLYCVKRLNNLRVPIEEGYFPKLNTQNTNTTWPPRFDNSMLSDLNRPNDVIHLDLSQMERWADRIIDAIEMGFAIKSDGTHVELNNKRGIDYLANIIQSSMVSVNRKYYGDLSNMGHAFISFCHDPEHKYLESYSVMGEPATAMRDPVFYRWHAYLAYIFQLHKKCLEPYSEKQLDYSGITIKSVRIQFQNKVDGTVKNLLQTFWRETDLDLSRGLDFSPKGSVFVRLPHLQHHPFTYKINIYNDAATVKRGTVRIFLAPKYDERGHRLTFEAQRLLMIEMDRFIIDIHPEQNVIIRRSDESSVAIQYDHTFNPEANRTKVKQGLESRSIFCKCGWPQHMLVPKGTEDGIVFVLFVMISNFNDDEVKGDILNDFKTCNDASSYCGVYHKKYPDARPMGFPFDRPATNSVIFLDEFIGSNMKAQDVVIKFLNRTVNSTTEATAVNPQTME